MGILARNSVANCKCWCEVDLINFGSEFSIIRPVIGTGSAMVKRTRNSESRSSMTSITLNIQPHSRVREMISADSPVISKRSDTDSDDFNNVLHSMVPAETPEPPSDIVDSSISDEAVSVSPAINAGDQPVPEQNDRLKLDLHEFIQPFESEVATMLLADEHPEDQSLTAADVPIEGHESSSDGNLSFQTLADPFQAAGQADAENAGSARPQFENERTEKPSSHNIHTHNVPMNTGMAESSPTSGDIAATTPRTLKSVESQIATETLQRLAIVEQSGSTTFTVRLDPPHLGQVIIKLEHSSAGITMKIHAMNADTQALLNERFPEIAQGMFEHDPGIALSIDADANSSAQYERPVRDESEWPRIASTAVIPNVQVARHDRIDIRA